MAQRGHPHVPIEWSNTREWIRRCAEAINSLRDGRINSVGAITLTASSATTTLSDRRIGPDSFIDFMPTTANASAALNDGSFYITARADGSCTINHTNDSNSDKTLTFVVLG
jgi:hypothetical protein